jgi:hypothetical protein
MHVDTGLQLIFFTEDLPPGAGGKLIVSNRGDVWGMPAIEADCTRIRPVAGQAIFFDARGHTHVVSALTDPHHVGRGGHVVLFAGGAGERQAG